MSISGNWEKHSVGPMGSLGEVDRRKFLKLSGASAAALILGYGPFTEKTWAQPYFSDYPFSMGVASGDPLPDGVVLWTRLAPDPLNGGGMPDRKVPVQWQVATDEGFGEIVREGTEIARPELAHSVHVEVTGLNPASEYFYRFKAGPELSPVGRTKTAPAADARVERLALAFVSCQNFTAGYYTAYQDLVQRDLDVVLHLGDYIYEGDGGGRPVRRYTRPTETLTLDDYRIRHADYKSDLDLQAAHAAFPFVLTWDDHEIDNNYASDDSDPDTPPEQFLERRAAAYQAYYEHLPLRAAQRPVGPDAQMYRRLSFGDLMQVHMLDTRQYRSDQPRCSTPDCPEARDPSRTMLGAGQEQWLQNGLRASSSVWDVLANQAPVRRYGTRPLGGDQWDGYDAARSRLLALLTQGPANPVVFTGDLHSNQVSDLPASFDDPAAPIVATEFMGTSVSSLGDSTPRTSYDGFGNSWERFRQFGQRGYVAVDLDRAQLLAEYRGVKVEQPSSTAYTVERFVVETGQRGVRLA